VKGALAREALLVAAVVLVIGGVLAAVFRGPGDWRAIAVSGAVALVVQCGAVSLGRMAGTGNLTARMGIGALLRFFALVLYAVLAVFALELPIAAALISLAAFFFISTLIEPLLIK
jgi:hypothetical protein